MPNEHDELESAAVERAARNKVKKRGLIGTFFFEWVSPVSTVKKYLRSSSGTSTIGGVGERFRFWGDMMSDGWGRAKVAVKEPENFATIEELELAWGISDETRLNQLRNLRIYRGFMVLISAVLIYSLITVNTWAYNIYIFIFASLASIIGVLLMMVIVTTVSWRIYVIAERKPVNYVAYMKGRR